MTVSVLSSEILQVEQTMRTTPATVIQQGKALYNKGAVMVTHVDARMARLTVVDSAVAMQRVSVQLSGRQITTSCTCERNHYWQLCKHRVAALLMLRDYLTENPPNVWREVLEEATRAPARRTGVMSQGVVVFSLQKRGGSWTILPHSLAGRHLPVEVRNDPDALAEYIATNRLSSEARPLRQRISQQSYPYVSSEAIAATNLALMYASSHNYGYSSYNYHYTGHSYGAVSGAAAQEPVLALLPDCLVYTGTEQDPLQQRIVVLEEAGELSLSVDEAPGGVRVSTQIAINEQVREMTSGEVQIVLSDPLWVLSGGLLFQVKDVAGNSSSLVQYPQLFIPQDESDDFFDRHLLRLAGHVQVGGNLVQWDDVQDEPQPRIYLSEEGGELKAHLRFGYGEIEVPYDRAAPEQSVLRKEDTTMLVRLYRQAEAEADAWKNLSSYGLKRDKEPGWFVLRRNTTPVDFLLKYVPRISEHGYEVFGEEELTTARVNRNRPSISFTVSSGIDWFDLEAVVSYGDLEVSLKDIRKALRKKARYIKLADGSIGAIPEDWVARYRHLFALGEETDTGLRLAHGHLTLLDELLSDADQTKIDEEYERRRKRLRDFSRLESANLPHGFVGELRPYQKAGYDWLHFLHSYGFGGCLADDMGTGKTVVTLAFLQSLREQGHTSTATLIVLPRSLLFNWEREAAAFTPGMRVFIHADQQRLQEPAEFDEYDIILTTYGIMLRDIKLLRKYTFHYLILDESQAIKNPQTETSKAARLLNGEHRLTLTGTPVENSSLELWSQFAFLNPGLLGSLDYFRQEFVTPIERKQDRETAKLLRAMVYPFILRRTKEQVALDLPPRSERTLVSEMEPTQREFYQRQRDYYRALLLGMIDDEGMNNARMQILEGLLRLRQICNHPRLVDGDFQGESAKFELLLETLETLHSEGHKALIFSQFVQMLSLVRAALDERGIPYSYLDGQTRNREAVVDQFQNDDTIPFFLISLKAGGVGLNLTAADYVIHIDPWWNPAVEMQATDRTHRIGQDKPVFVYRLVVRDSVEEKILQLQERKRDLVDQLIATEGSVFKALTREDVELLFT